MSAALLLTLLAAGPPASVTVDQPGIAATVLTEGVDWTDTQDVLGACISLAEAIELLGQVHAICSDLRVIAWGFGPMERPQISESRARTLAFPERLGPCSEWSDCRGSP